MPTVSFYLKNEDYDKWVALPHKGEFIHNALNPYDGLGGKPTYVMSASDKGIISKPIKTPKMTKEALDYAKRGDEAAAAVMGLDVIKQPKDIPPLARDEPDWGGPMWKKGKRK